MLKPSAMDKIKLKTELKFIDSVMVPQINSDIKFGIQPKSNAHRSERLKEHEVLTAEYFLTWLQERKTQLDTISNQKIKSTLAADATLPNSEITQGIVRIQPERETFGFRLNRSNETTEDSKDALSILKLGKLISQGTTLPQLNGILYNQKEIKKSVEWIGSVPALHEFIAALWQPHGNKKGKWQVGLNCFLFNECQLTVKQLQNNKGASQKDKETIKKAIAALKITT